jgi:hypothetical protein
LGRFCPFGAGFATKALRAQSFDFPLLLGLPCFAKRLKAGGFRVWPVVLAKTPGRKVFLFLPGKRSSSFENDSPSPDSPEASEGNPFDVRRGGQQKIATDSGISSCLISKFQIFEIPNSKFQLQRASTPLSVTKLHPSRVIIIFPLIYMYKKQTR